MLQSIQSLGQWAASAVKILLRATAPAQMKKAGQPLSSTSHQMRQARAPLPCKAVLQRLPQKICLLDLGLALDVAYA